MKMKFVTNELKRSILSQLLADYGNVCLTPAHSTRLQMLSASSLGRQSSTRIIYLHPLGQERVIVPPPAALCFAFHHLPFEKSNQPPSHGPPDARRSQGGNLQQFLGRPQRVLGAANGHPGPPISGRRWRAMPSCCALRMGMWCFEDVTSKGEPPCIDRHDCGHMFLGFDWV